MKIFCFYPTHGWDNMGEIIRILHGCEVRIENSVPRVTVWHHEAMPSDAKQWSRGTEFSYLHRTLMFDSFSCLPFEFECFILKVAFIIRYNDNDVGNVFKMTSLWCQNDVNLTTKLREVLYNQCKLNSREKFFLGWANMGEIRISMPSENLGFPYPECKKRISIPSENFGFQYPVCKK